jgi:hypothetical protein
VPSGQRNLCAQGPGRANQGFFKKVGLNVTVQKFTGGGATSVAALAITALGILLTQAAAWLERRMQVWRT